MPENIDILGSIDIFEVPIIYNNPVIAKEIFFFYKTEMLKCFLYNKKNNIKDVYFSKNIEIYVNSLDETELLALCKKYKKNFFSDNIYYYTNLKELSKTILSIIFAIYFIPFLFKGPDVFLNNNSRFAKLPSNQVAVVKQIPKLQKNASRLTADEIKTTRTTALPIRTVINWDLRDEQIKVGGKSYLIGTKAVDNQIIIDLAGHGNRRKGLNEVKKAALNKYKKEYPNCEVIIQPYEIDHPAASKIACALNLRNNNKTYDPSPVCALDKTLNLAKNQKDCDCHVLPEKGEVCDFFVQNGSKIAAHLSRKYSDIPGIERQSLGNRETHVMWVSDLKIKVFRPQEIKPKDEVFALNFYNSIDSRRVDSEILATQHSFDANVDSNAVLNWYIKKNISSFRYNHSLVYYCSSSPKFRTIAIQRLKNVKEASLTDVSLWMEVESSFNKNFNQNEAQQKFKQYETSLKNFGSALEQSEANRPFSSVLMTPEEMYTYAGAKRSDISNLAGRQDRIFYGKNFYNHE